MKNFSVCAPVKMLGLGLVLLGYGCGQAMAAPGDLTGEAILRKSANAYLALKQYTGTTTVVDHAVIDGHVLDDTATAQINFDRKTNRLRIDGLMTGNGAYTIVSDGKDVSLRTVMYGNEDAEKAKSVESAVTAMTGVGGRAPTLITSALLKLKWQYLFAQTENARLTGQENVNSFPCYRVTLNLPHYDQTFWIDSKSFLLRRYKLVRDRAKIWPAGTKLPSGRNVPPSPKQFSSSEIHTFYIHGAYFQ